MTKKVLASAVTLGSGIGKIVAEAAAEADLPKNKFGHGEVKKGTKAGVPETTKDFKEPKWAT